MSLKDFYEKYADSSNVPQIEINSNGEILLYSGYGYWLIDYNGKLLKEGVWEKKIYNLFWINNTDILVQTFQNGGMEIGYTQLDNNSIDRISEIKGDIYFDFVLWDENTLLMRNDSSLFQYNIKEKYMTKVFNWSEYGIVRDYISAIYIEDEDIHCIIGEEDQLRDIAWKKSGIRQEEFLRACLEYAKYLPEKVIYESDDVVRRDGEVFFDICGIYTVKDYMYKKSVWGSDASHTGFPSAKGNGMAIVPLNTYGISAKSDQKEKAWEFIEYFFTKEGQEKITPNYDFSICSDILNQQFEQAMEIYTYTDEEQVIHEHPILSYYLEGACIDVYAPRKEDIENIKSMIGEVEVVSKIDNGILIIIREEAASYFAGQKTLDEVVDLIKKRWDIEIEEVK